MADWEIDANGNLVKVGAADNGINPTTDLPWGVYPDKGSPTGYTHTASGTPVYKDGSAWSGTTSDRAINVNVAAPVTWGPSQTDDDGHVTGVPGAVYQINSRGDVSILNKPTTTKPAASLWNDTNGDGYDDQSGLPNGVTSIGGKLYFQGKRVNPDGSLYTGTDEAKDAPTWTGYGPKGQGTYRLDGPGGTPGTYIGPTTAAGAGISSSSGGGGSSSGGGSSGGGSAGGGLTTHAGGYNNTSTSIHEGGYTNTNISEIGPLEAAIRASEFAANNALSRNKAQQDSAALYAQLLSAVDPNAYQAFLETNGGGRLDNALLSGGNALSANAINPAAMALEAARGLNQPASAGGGLSNPGAGGGGPVSPGAGGGLTPVPAAAPGGNGAIGGGGGGGAVQGPVNNGNYTGGATAGVASRSGVGGITQGDYGGNAIDHSKFYASLQKIFNGGPGTQSIDPSQRGYVDPRVSTLAQRKPGEYMTNDQMNAIALGGATGLVGPTAIPYGNDDIQRQIPALPYENDNIQRQIPVAAPAPVVDAPLSDGLGHFWDSNTQAWQNDSGGAYVPAFAGGGLTRERQMITGDPQGDGMPNPEMIVNPTGAPISVVPLRDMPPQMAQRAMGGLPRHAYGSDVIRTGPSVFVDTYDPNYEPPVQNYDYGISSALSQPVYQQPTYQPEPVAQPSRIQAPVYQQPAPVQQPQSIAQPVAQTQPAPVTTAPATQPANNPAQIGTYSTAPGSAGQPVAAQPAAQTPVQQPVAQPATTVPASVVSGASGGSTQPSQAAFDEVMFTRLAAVNPWMSDPTSYMNVDYGTRDPIARRNYEQWLTMKYGVPQESIDFAQARNRLGGASMASMSQGR